MTLVEPCLRDFQKSALERLRDQSHVVCLAPTGSGKSRIYEVAAATLAKRTLLITPLIALGNQQASQLRELQFSVALNLGGTWAPPTSGDHIWITSPEYLATPSGQKLLQEWKPELWVIDECHCWSEWGESFRPAYGHLPNLFRVHAPRRSLWLSATFRRSEILRLEEALGVPLTVEGGFDLPSGMHLSLIEARAPDRLPLLQAFLSRQISPGLIFCATRRETESVHRLLSHWNIPSLYYHAGLSQEERLSLEQRLRRSDRAASCSPTHLVATTAFGMGMNFLSFRWSLLWQPLFTVEAIAQAIGRCGRGPEKTSKAILFHHAEDLNRLKTLAPKGFPEVRALIQEPLCRLARLSQIFDERDPSTATPPKRFCQRCDLCLRRPEKFINRSV
jgi:ATP-dependent DNA helicase RecQ